MVPWHLGLIKIKKMFKIFQKLEKNCANSINLRVLASGWSSVARNRGGGGGGGGLHRGLMGATVSWWGVTARWVDAIMGGVNSGGAFNL